MSTNQPIPIGPAPIKRFLDGDCITIRITNNKWNIKEGEQIPWESGSRSGILEIVSVMYTDRDASMIKVKDVT